MTSPTKKVLTFQQAFNVRHNSLNFIRLVLAVAVLVGHVTGQTLGQTVKVGNEALGDWAVEGFFAISGFLIMRSRMSSPNLRSFMWRRVLRIYPAFFGALIITAFVIAPVSVFVFGDGQFNLESSLGYFYKNASLVILQPEISGTLTGLDYPTWNAPLWTLAYEFGCYLFVGLLVTIVPARGIRVSTMVAFVLALIVTAITIISPEIVPDPITVFGRLGSFFLAGSLLSLFASKVPVSWRLASIAAACSILLVVFQSFQFWGSIPLAYLMLWLGTRLPFQKLGAKNDVSYGIYIYHWPVLVLILVALEGNQSPFWLTLGLTVALTVPLAMLSWFLIEKPAMSLKKLVR
jgi:peptidoglycan/LPS O-acetylase OafA/YrhL